MDKMAIARRKCARGAVLTLLFGNPRAAVMQMAGERGYQTLINEALKNSLQQSDIEATIRKVIREELKERKAA